MTVGYAVDPLSAWFLVTFAVLAAPVAVYSVGYLAHAIPPGRTAFVGVAWNVLLMSVETVFAADGVLGFLVAWELMTLATAALVATDHESRPSRRSAFLYLAMSHLGTGCLVAAFFLLAAGSGSLAFAEILGGRRGGEPVARPPVRPLPRGLRREGRRRPAARLAPGGAPGRSEPASRP